MGEQIREHDVEIPAPIIPDEQGFREINIRSNEENHSDNAADERGVLSEPQCEYGKQQIAKNGGEIENPSRAKGRGFDDFSKGEESRKEHDDHENGHGNP